MVSPRGRVKDGLQVVADIERPTSHDHQLPIDQSASSVGVVDVSGVHISVKGSERSPGVLYRKLGEGRPHPFLGPPIDVDNAGAVVAFHVAMNETRSDLLPELDRDRIIDTVKPVGRWRIPIPGVEPSQGVQDCGDLIKIHPFASNTKTTSGASSEVFHQD